MDSVSRIIRLICTAVVVLVTGSSLWAATAASDLRQVGMVNIPGAPGFETLAFANGMLLMTHPGASDVEIFDPVRRQVVAEITGMQSPRGIAVDEQAGRVYIADHGADAITMVSFDHWQVIDNIRVQGTPDNLLVNDGRLYWTDAENGTVSAMDLATKQTVNTVKTGGTPRRLAFDPQRKVIFATVQDLHQVIALDPQLQIVNRFNLDASQPTGLVYSPQAGELYVAVRYAVLAINAQNGVEVNRVPAPEGVDSLWLDASAKTLYAASEGSLLVLRADGRLSVVEEVKTDVKGHTVAYDPARNLILLPGGRDGKSKVLILRPTNANSQPAFNDATVR